MFHRSVSEILRGGGIRPPPPLGCEMGQNNPALLGLKFLECENFNQPRRYYAKKLKEFLLNTYHEDKVTEILLNQTKTLQLILTLFISSHPAIADIMCLTPEETSYVVHLQRLMSLITSTRKHPAQANRWCLNGTSAWNFFPDTVFFLFLFI